jgi:hypothetical protein
MNTRNILGVGFSRNKDHANIKWFAVSKMCYKVAATYREQTVQLPLDTTALLAIIWQHMWSLIIDVLLHVSRKIMHGLSLKCFVIILLGNLTMTMLSLFFINTLKIDIFFLKRTLSLILQQVGYSIFAHSTVTYSPREMDMNRENNDLVNLLRTQLSEAINLQNKDTIAQLHEALRCVRQFDGEGYVTSLYGWFLCERENIMTTFRNVLLFLLGVSLC